LGFNTPFGLAAPQFKSYASEKRFRVSKMPDKVAAHHEIETSFRCMVTWSLCLRNKRL